MSHLRKMPKKMDVGQRSRSGSSSSEDGRKDSHRKPPALHNAPSDDGTEEDEKKKSKTSKAGKSSKKYKYATAYFNFLQDFRAQNSKKKMPAVEVARQCGEAWRLLSKNKRLPYETAAEANRMSQRGKKRRGAGRVEKARKAAKKSKKRKAARHNDAGDVCSESD